MQIAVAKRLQHTAEYYFSKKLREIDELNKTGEPVINLGIGSPDLPPHPEVIDTLTHYASQPDTHAYQSYKGVPALRQAISNWYKRYYHVSINPDTEVLPLIGSKEGIVHICMTYLQEGDEALIPNPGYPAYASAVRLSGATSIPYTLSAENDWQPDLHALGQRDLSRVKLMWINYPHMPTGASATVDFFEKIVAFAKEHNILLCHDNPYSFILNDSPKSLMATPGALDVAIELNSLSKSANMAGWRIGMLIAKADRINEILRFKSNMDSGMFLPAQMAAAKALSLDQSWYDELNAVYRERREKIYEILDILQAQYDRRQVGMFVWARVPASATDGYGLSDQILYHARVFITPGGIFGDAGNAYIRMSLCAPVSRFEEALERIRHSLAKEASI